MRLLSRPLRISTSGSTKRPHIEQVGLAIRRHRFEALVLGASIVKLTTRSRVRQVWLVARDREVRALCRWVSDKEHRMRWSASHELISLSMKGIAAINPCTHPHQVAKTERKEHDHRDG